MLSMFIAGILGGLAVIFAVGAGELRYEKPEEYPQNQRVLTALAFVLVTLGLACARYL